MKRVSETHKSYDALQNLILFPKGDDGNHFNLRQINPKNGTETTKKSIAFFSFLHKYSIGIDTFFDSDPIHEILFIPNDDTAK